MALFDRFKRMLIPEEKRKKKEYPTEKQGADSQDELHADGKQMNVAKSDRQMRVYQLTPREHDLYLLLLEGFTLKESATRLSIKYSTTNTHMSGIYKKLGVNSRAELIINYRGINSEKTQTPLTGAKKISNQKDGRSLCCGEKQKLEKEGEAPAMNVRSMDKMNETK